ncbi:hypothetical protein [Accumulibacter sp.]|uniref:hypothetical protein n=1 Tax=Accumulibacter sp. TaxID=2053492 RepID=UPI0026275009|nr:hypothetical protein [Accumulibacter sp.]
MIPVPRIPEPADFDKECRQKGMKWLKANPDGTRPRDFWSPFRNALADGFANRCGYGAMWIASGTVDHFVSVDADKAQAYEWDNYRYLDNWMNSCKRNANDLLDPFLVGDGWFEILLPSMQLVLTDAVPPAFRQQAETTLQRLRLRDHETLLRQRREWYRMYQEDKLSIDGLREKAPLIAAAVEKQSP